ncbi:MAG: DUF6326 family protein [Bacteroidota bacterium]
MSSPFADAPVPVRVRLSLLWATIMSLYIYADYFKLMTPGEIDNLKSQQMPFGETTPDILIAFSILLILPALMIAASVLLPALTTRWLNIILASLYALISILILISDIRFEWLRFFVLYQIVELGVFSLIIWQAWNWPREVETH